ETNIGVAARSDRVSIPGEPVAGGQCGTLADGAGRPQFARPIGPQVAVAGLSARPDIGACAGPHAGIEASRGPRTLRVALRHALVTAAARSIWADACVTSKAAPA